MTSFLCYFEFVMTFLKHIFKSWKSAEIWFCLHATNPDHHIKYFLLIFSVPPEIEVEKNWVHSGEGVTTDVMCIVHASLPLMRIQWLRKGGDEVKTVDRSIDKDGSTHTLKLELRKVTKDDFGEYTCVVENELGMDEKKIHISGILHAQL